MHSHSICSTALDPEQTYVFDNVRQNRAKTTLMFVSKVVQANTVHLI